MLSPLQERIRWVLSDLPAGGDLALAGGAALIVWGVVSRPTKDLDFFATSSAAVNRLVPEIEAALEGDGLEVRRVQVANGFARLMVSSRNDETVADVAGDARRFPRAITEEGPLLAVDELAGDKLLALFGRAAARDFVDVAALVDRYGLERLCELAAEKDRGFDRRVLADMLGRICGVCRRGTSLRRSRSSWGPGRGLSAATITRLLETWSDEYQAFGSRDLSDSDFVCRAPHGTPHVRRGAPTHRGSQGGLGAVPFGVRRARQGG